MSNIINILAAVYDSVEELQETKEELLEAGEMLWTVLASVSGGDWSKQSPEWQAAATRWRDNWFDVMMRAKVKQ